MQFVVFDFEQKKQFSVNAQNWKDNITVYWNDRPRNKTIFRFSS